MVQQPTVAERFRKSYPYVDILFGTQVQHRLPEFIYKRITLGKRVYELSLDNKEVVEGIPVYRESKIKGFLPVMYGCDNFCTYCIVPYVRGRERSRDPEEIISEAVQMVNDGCKEIMLLGQNVNSYGKGIENGIDFADLLYRINAIDGDFRIRFMTSHPKDCTEKLLDAIRDCEKVERHLHLPFQSGSDEILKKMNRRYDSSAYLELIRKARERMPDITFTSDVIVGFPQETYEDFKKTVELVKSVRFLSLFTFIYSPRTGTPAAAMDDPVSREEKGKWFDELLRVQQSVTDEIMKSFEGKTVRVLCEEASTNCGMLTGKASNGISVEFAADECLLGKFVNVKINSYNGTLKGTLLKEERNGD